MSSCRPSCSSLPHNTPISSPQPAVRHHGRSRVHAGDVHQLSCRVRLWQLRAAWPSDTRRAQVSRFWDMPAGMRRLLRIVPMHRVGRLAEGPATRRSRALPSRRSARLVSVRATARWRGWLTSARQTRATRAVLYRARVRRSRDRAGLLRAVPPARRGAWHVLFHLTHGPVQCPTRCFLAAVLCLYITLLR